MFFIHFIRSEKSSKAENAKKDIKTHHTSAKSYCFFNSVSCRNWIPLGSQEVTLRYIINIILTVFWNITIKQTRSYIRKDKDTD